MPFFSLAADVFTKITVSLATKSLGETIGDVRTQRKMTRLVEDAIDRVVAQIEEYLRGEGIDDRRKDILLSSLTTQLEELVRDPQRFFLGDLDGSSIFKQSHPDGVLPQEIREEGLSQVYVVLFPQIAHFLAGSRLALSQWQAEGYREEFKRLGQIAEEIRAMNAKVAELPEAAAEAIASRASKEAEAVLRDFAQTLLNNLLLRLDLSPLRAERALHGSLGDHFVIPAVRQRLEQPEFVFGEQPILDALVPIGARRFVHGGAGIGKTTCSLWLQSRLLQTGQRLCIVLRLREANDIENRSLLDLLKTKAGPHLRDKISNTVLERWYATGRLVVILDGFDELPEDRRNAVETWIRSLAAIAAKTALLITSRPLQSNHLEDLTDPWQQWDIVPFDEPRITEFISRWHRYLPEAELSPVEREVDPSSLARTFLNDPSLRPLADTPLMLGTLLFVHHRDKKLPNGRVDLYERYIAAMLGLRDSGLGILARATKLSDKEKRRVLAHVAMHFLINGVNEVNDEVMRKLVSQALETYRLEETVDRILPAMHERTGLLQGPGTWSFMHKTIGEFLVAELICDGMTRLPDDRRLDRNELWISRSKDSWTSVMFFWAGKTSSRELEQFIEELLKANIPEDTLLALSLLNDQGDRLDFGTQRRFATQIAKTKIPIPVATRFISIATIPCLPLEFCTEIEAESRELRGIAKVSDTAAYSKLLSDGTLRASDLQESHSTTQKHFLISLLWSLGWRNSVVRLRDLAEFDSDAPISTVASGFHALIQRNCHDPTDEGLPKRLRDSLDEWLLYYPATRNIIPIFIAGIVVESDLVRRNSPTVSSKNRFFNTLKALGPVLYDWRSVVISRKWLIGTMSCQDRHTRTKIDMLKELRTILSTTCAEEWRLTLEQFHQLKEAIAQWEDDRSTTG